MASASPLRSSITKAGENAYGLRTVAAPVLEQTGRAIPAVSATVSADRCELEPFITVAIPKVVAAAGQLTEAVRLTFGEIIREDLRK